MIYLIFDIIAASSSLAITRDKDAFFSCPARIETLFVVFPVFMLISVKAVDRFSAVLSASAKFLFWRNIYYSSF
jgi:hypothetical protein